MDNPRPAPTFGRVDALVSPKVLAASVAGLGHERRDVPGQDAFGWRWLASTATLTAVMADGAGSAPLGGEGAKIAVDTVLGELTTQPLDTGFSAATLRSAAAMAREALAQEAARLQTPARDFATTLLIAVVTLDHAIAWQLGDGAVLLADDGQPLEFLTKPPASEYLNETVFLTSENALETAHIMEKTGRTARLAMFTDGLQLVALKMQEARAHEPFFTPLFDFLRNCGEPAEAQNQLETFLRSPRLRERTDDDLSLLLASFDVPQV